MRLMTINHLVSIKGRPALEVTMRKKFTLIFFALIFFFLCLPSSLTALAADDEYTYIDENGDPQITTASAITSGTATLSTGWYVVNTDVTRTGTITVSGDAKLILVDGKRLTVTASSNNAGISVVGGNSLTIYGQAEGTGVLKATGDEYGAGIGGRLYETHPTTGTITINGGTVNASGGTNGAGIGSISFRIYEPLIRLIWISRTAVDFGVAGRLSYPS